MEGDTVTAWHRWVANGRRKRRRTVEAHSGPSRQAACVVVCPGHGRRFPESARSLLPHHGCVMVCKLQHKPPSSHHSPARRRPCPCPSLHNRTSSGSLVSWSSVGHAPRRHTALLLKRWSPSHASAISSTRVRHSPCPHARPVRLLSSLFLCAPCFLAVRPPSLPPPCLSQTPEAELQPAMHPSNYAHWSLTTARDLTLEAARDASNSRKSSTRMLPSGQLKKLLDSRSEREVLEGLRRVVTVCWTPALVPR